MNYSVLVYKNMPDEPVEFDNVKLLFFEDYNSAINKLAFEYSLAKRVVCSEEEDYKSFFENNQFECSNGYAFVFGEVKAIN